MGGVVNELGVVRNGTGSDGSDIQGTTLNSEDAITTTVCKIPQRHSKPISSVLVIGGGGSTVIHRGVRGSGIDEEPVRAASRHNDTIGCGVQDQADEDGTSGRRTKVGCGINSIPLPNTHNTLNKHGLCLTNTPVTVAGTTPSLHRIDRTHKTGSIEGTSGRGPNTGVNSSVEELLLKTCKTTDSKVSNSALPLGADRGTRPGERHNTFATGKPLRGIGTRFRFPSPLHSKEVQ